MGSSANCDDGIKDIEEDLKDMEKESTCNEVKSRPVMMTLSVLHSRTQKGHLRLTNLRGGETTKQQCFFPSKDYSPKHHCMGEFIG